MKPLEFIGLFAICAGGMFIVYWLLAEWGQKCLRQANEYEEYHNKLKGDIYEFSINKPNYNILMSRLVVLSNMKWKDKEKTSVLLMEFLDRFKTEKLLYVCKCKKCHKNFKSSVKDFPVCPTCYV